MIGYNEERRRAILNRLAKASGHLDAVRRMIDDGRDCSDVLIQLSAVRSAINNTEKIILKDYIERCLNDALCQNDEDAVDRMNEAIDKFIK